MKLKLRRSKRKEVKRKTLPTGMTVIQRSEKGKTIIEVPTPQIKPLFINPIT